MSKIKRVCVDLDGVVADFVTSAIVNLQNEFPYLPIDWQPKQFDFGAAMSEEFGIDKTITKKLMHQMMDRSDFWRNLPAFEDNVNALRCGLLLDPNKYEVFYLTSRFKGTLAPTNDWLRCWNLLTNSTGVIEVEHKTDKASVILAIGADYSIDDSLEVIETTYFLGGHNAYLLTRPWNLVTDLPIQRVNSMQEFVECVKR